ncbi:hypothetical protein CC86DRAFT_462124 [Ophiobolus disseminans]|uniref:Uncharacterized protein n=1 Tax=Ophiobolus disseminans TaxID=1469910 RepID=A0A6A7AKT0_9PLEO|nr:hypothetical protein CC86DRAFT_462124 [Ophiobolus disseminans]
MSKHKYFHSTRFRTLRSNSRIYATMTSTPDLVSWTAEPHGRGTMGLLWSCFATIFLCTWSAIHPNLPGVNESQVRTFWRRISHVVGCLVAPEYYGLDALLSLAGARTVQAQTPGWPLRKCFYLIMGGFIVEHDSGEEKHRKFMKPEYLIELCTQKKIPWPEVDEDDIDDRSKADGLVKLLALTQISWFVIQSIGRAAQGLAVTTVELFTLGIVVWAVMIYIVLWQKPFDVQRPTVVYLKGSEFEDVIKRDPDVKRVSFINNSSTTRNDDLWSIGIGIVVSLGFAALHVVAWQFHFSTTAELWLWRVSSVLCTLTPLFIAMLLGRETLMVPQPGTSTEMETSTAVMVFILGIIYTIGRIYMFVEMFISLRAVPSSVYETPQWSQYFPSFG